MCAFYKIKMIQGFLCPIPFVDQAKEKNERSDEGKYNEHEGMRLIGTIGDGEKSRRREGRYSGRLGRSIAKREASMGSARPKQRRGRNNELVFVLVRLRGAKERGGPKGIRSAATRCRWGLRWVLLDRRRWVLLDRRRCGLRTSLVLYTLIELQKKSFPLVCVLTWLSWIVELIY